MKQTLIVVFIFLLSSIIPAQKKATDKGMEGLKGAAKTVLTEYVQLGDSSGSASKKERVIFSLDTYEMVKKKWRENSHA